jgi:hypothetical protein
VTSIELVALVDGALADLGAGPGVLADYLDEAGDPRGPLLRRRWKRWLYHMECLDTGRRVRASRWCRRPVEARRNRADTVFFRYIMNKFPEARW